MLGSRRPALQLIATLLLAIFACAATAREADELLSQRLPALTESAIANEAPLAADVPSEQANAIESKEVPTTSPAGRGLTESALQLIGVHYRRGGESPSTGLDCSGLVRYVFHDVLGRDLPHRAAELARLGAHVARNDLQPGDVILFNNLRRSISHVAIYIGDGQFIHAPAAGKKVRIESLETGYWLKRYIEGRRIE